MAMRMEVGSPEYEQRMDALMAARLAEPLFGDPAGHFTTLEGLLERQEDFDLLDRLDRNAGNGER